MDNIKVYQPPGQVSQVEAFIEVLHPKLREKLVWQIFRLSRTPPAGLKEPHYKHFSIEKYRDFYELREKNRIVIRVIFTVLPNGEVLLLHTFQKRQSRDTMRALERSLKLLTLLRDHPERAVEYIVEEERKS
ncbi:type II toxin-antitoxin system RelE/ParE family toxin [uncultured Oscillibacter sp.]|uniref:type II toxin-antitoxin system RelE/ParE family toxin n=1 Tax=uncultured Oscillibacter sp. TaxID=876091 RepID=UPI0026127611|nr:type II toxin-antitoxin system RelE/ParE family toxin [uncultured Oscillibacter sp.]